MFLFRWQKILRMFCFQKTLSLDNLPRWAPCSSSRTVIYISPWKPSKRKNHVAAGFPVFLFPALLDHVMSFFVVVRSYSIYQLERFTRSNDVLTLDNVYIPLFVRTAWSCPTCMYPWLYGLVCFVQIKLQVDLHLTNRLQSIKHSILDDTSETF